MLVGGGQGVFGGGVGGGDFGDAGAARGAGAAGGGGVGEGDLVGGVEGDGEDVVLAEAHRGLEVVAVGGEEGGAEDFGGEVPGVGGEVAEEVVEGGGGGVGNEGGAAPMVEEGVVGGFGWGQGVEEEIAVMEAGEDFRGEGFRGEKRGGVLLGQAALYGLGVGHEGGVCGRGGLGVGGEGCERDEESCGEQSRQPGAALHGMYFAAGDGFGAMQRGSRGLECFSRCKFLPLLEIGASLAVGLGVFGGSGE